MYTLVQLVLVYLIGGVTFLPLVVVAVLLHAYFTFPTYASLSAAGPAGPANLKDNLQRPGDDEQAIRTKLGDLVEKEGHRTREPDVAAGYFAVCREYVPGGINGKPPERTTPAGEIVPTESPSVYQSVYRSIFDRSKAPSIDNGKGNVKTTKKARNVFFVVLRLGHLMFYDDADQLEVRYVVSLAHHDVSIYAGGEEIPEGELFIRRNAIALTRKEHAEEFGPDTVSSKPFYFFTDNCSDKEDFYYALLQSHDFQPPNQNHPLQPEHFEVKDVITLVQRLHSSEEHLQTRWVNALIGRLFLALYKSPSTESFIRHKIAKKISRVKTPAFLSDISIRKIDMGSGAPNVTNPRLKDFNVDGECAVEADVSYAGNFRIEIATIARIDLGTRFKTREVSLVLAVLLKKLEGHGILRFKAPPSNRVWFAFETMPKMDMSIEPIVSSRQITYNVILRVIESRIREVMAETLVLPHWDDLPFTNTVAHPIRGGIWASDSSDPMTKAESDTDQDVVVHDTHSAETGTTEEANVDQQYASKGKTMSMPMIKDPSDTPTSKTTETPKPISREEAATSSGYQAQSGADRRRPLRSTSFASSSTPLVGTDRTTAEVYRPASRENQEDATTAMMRIRSKSQPGSPAESPVGSPPQPTIQTQVWGSKSSSASSKDNTEGQPEQTIPRSIFKSATQTSFPPSPSSISSDSLRSAQIAAATDFSRNGSVSGSQGSPGSEKRQSLAALSTATAAAAKKWGLGVIQRNMDKRTALDHANDHTHGNPSQPMGRGRPLPPPGMPLPLPEKKTKPKPAPLDATSTKTLPRTLRGPASAGGANERLAPASHSRRASQISNADSDNNGNGLLVVAAPSAESEPTTPSPSDDAAHHFAHAMELDDPVLASKISAVAESDEPGGSSRHTARTSSMSSARSNDLLEDSGGQSWDAAQEEDVRSRNVWSEIEEGHS